MALRRRLQHHWVRLRRSLVVGPVLAGYCVLVVGVPLPIPAFEKIHLAFPCQDHCCGCLNADQCWTHCCCFSHAQHLAWARAHQVEPPAEFWAVQTDTDCCARHKAHALSSCCENSPPIHSQPNRSWILGMNARQCRGLGTEWISVNPLFLPFGSMTWSSDRSPNGWLSFQSVALPFLSTQPPAPPPRG